MTRFANAASACLLLILVFANSACTPTPPTLLKYKKNGIAFAHLSDWKVTGDAVMAEAESVRTIDLEGPRDAVISIIVMPSASEMTLDAYAGIVAQERGQALPTGKFMPLNITTGTSHATSAEVGGMPRQGILQKFNITLLGLAVPHESTFFAVEDEDRKAFIYTQVSTEDANAVAKGFTALRSSFNMTQTKGRRAK